jgi:hypothetical protein
VQQVITSGTASTMALAGSTENEQFLDEADLLAAQSQGDNFTAHLVTTESARPASWEESDELMPSGD